MIRRTSFSVRVECLERSHLAWRWIISSEMSGENRRKFPPLSLGSSDETSLDEIDLSLEVQVGQDDKMFGSVTNAHIVEALVEQRITIDRHKIELKEPLRALGVYSLPVKIAPEIEATLKVWVNKAIFSNFRLP